MRISQLNLLSNAITNNIAVEILSNAITDNIAVEIFTFTDFVRVLTDMLLRNNISQDSPQGTYV